MLSRIFSLGGDLDRSASPTEQFFATDRRPLLALAIGCFVVFFLYNGQRDLWTPDEPRFGQICKEMLQDGHIFVLHLNGRPYSDKPPLYFYLVCLLALGAGWLQGAVPAALAEWMVRFPSAAAATAGVFCLYWIARRLLNRRAAFFSAAVMGLNWTYGWQGRNAQLDMLMCAFVFAAMGCWLQGDAEEGRRGRWTHLFYACAALATLSKGPPGFIVPFGAVIVYRCWQANARRTLRSAAAWCAVILVLGFLAGNEEADRDPLVSAHTLFVLTGLATAGLLAGCLIAWRDLLARIHLGRHALGFALFAALILAWLIPMNLLSPQGHSGDVLLGQTIQRYFNPEHHRGSMLTYYPLRLLTNWAPWTLFAPAALWAAFRSKAPLMPLEARRFALSWVAFTFVFFSLSPGKRDQYLLPCWPAVALLFGGLFDRAMDRERRLDPRWISVPNYIVGAMLLLGAAWFLALHFVVVERTWPLQAADEALIDGLGPLAPELMTGVPLGILAVPLALGATLVLGAARRRNVAAGFWGLGLALAAAWALVAVIVIPPLNEMRSGRKFCDAIDAVWTPDQDVAMYKIGRDTYTFYGDYRTWEIDDRRFLTAHFARPGRQFAIMRMDDFTEKLSRRINGAPLFLIAETHVSSRHVVCVSDIPPDLPGPSF
jgi:4-amino-4-deoxy-L-arabinose transferase-like glycosyltransferase